MALLAVQAASYPSFAPVLVAATVGGDTAPPGDNYRLVVKNGGGAPINVTLSSFPNTTDWGGAIPDLVVAVPAAGERWIGPLRGPAHADPTTGLVSIAYSAVTTVTVGIVAT